MVRRAKKRYPAVHEMTPSQQVGLVREVFATIPGRYDFLNRFLSLRRDVAWRRFAVRKMRFFRTMRFLDVATGTADLAVETARRYPAVRVAGLDFVREMMAVGREKIRRRHMADRIGLIQGDALTLPFKENAFDVAAIAFGIRNIPDRRRALEQMARAVVPGGQVMALEMNFPRHALLNRFYDLYLSRALPRVARLFSRNPAAYYYLGDSIREFPSPDQFARLMVQAGLMKVEKYALTLGITYLYIGVKPERAS